MKATVTLPAAIKSGDKEIKTLEFDNYQLFIYQKSFLFQPDYTLS